MSTNSSISPQEAQALSESGGCLLLDVRTTGEYESQRIASAFNVPLDQVSSLNAAVGDLKGRKLLLVCQSGSRAEQARTKLAELGLNDASVVTGGVNGWMAAGLPVETLKERWSLERQVRFVAGMIALIASILALTVDVRFAGLSAFIGAGLTFSGLTNFCGMAMLLAKLPYNRGARWQPTQVLEQLCAACRTQSPQAG